MRLFTALTFPVASTAACIEGTFATVRFRFGAISRITGDMT